MIKNKKYTEKGWGTLFQAIENSDNKYEIPDIIYFYLFNKAKDKYLDLLYTIF